jgi:hypothetical protein
MQYKKGWRIRSNNELQKLITGADIVKYINAQGIKWWGHLNGMEDIKLGKKITDCNPIGIRTKGRPKNRWRDEVINYFKKPEPTNWIQLVNDTKAWNELVQ